MTTQTQIEIAKIEAPKSWYSYEKERFLEIWAVDVPKDFKGYTQLYYCTYKSNSQSSYRPHYIEVWGFKSGKVKLGSYTSYGAARVKNLDPLETLEWDGSYYSIRSVFGPQYTWLKAVPKDLSWFFSGKDGEVTGRKDKHRGKGVTLNLPPKLKKNEILNPLVPTEASRRS